MTPWAWIQPHRPSLASIRRSSKTTRGPARPTRSWPVPRCTTSVTSTWGTDRAAAALAPGGVLIIIEWSYEKFDEATARWSFDRLPDNGEHGWLHHHRELWLASGQPWHTYLDDWAEREGLHNGHAIVQALQARFHTRLLTEAPDLFPDLYPSSVTHERAAAHRGEIQATGIRYIGVKP